MKTTVTPLYDYLLVTKEEVSDRLDSGLYIPQTSEAPDPIRVRVVAVGPGRLLDSGLHLPTGISVGEVLIIAPYNSAVQVAVSGRQHLLLRANDVIARVSHAE